MRRLARGATVLALAVALRAEAARDAVRAVPLHQALGAALVMIALGALGVALGRTAFAAGQHGDAPAYDHMEYALAPDLPGFLRALGSTYDKIGVAAPQRELYRRYLEQRMGRACCRAW